MTDYEFVDKIAKGLLSNGEILDYCNGLSSMHLKELVNDIELEILSYECCGDVAITDNNDEDGNMLLNCNGGNSYTEEVGRLISACDFICKEYNINRLFQNEEQQPQQKDLHYYCQKAIEKGYLVKANGNYRLGSWTKAQLAYLLKHFPNTDGTFPDKKYCVMFGENRLSKAADQLSMNKNGDGKPRGYEIVDELLQE